MILEEQAERYFATARERYNIRLRRLAGAPPPWTDDPIFGAYRFCNVFREDDRVTDWVRRNVRSPFFFNHNVVYAMAVCRFFNLPSTLQIIKDHHLFESWNPFLMRQLLEGKSPLITGAYMVKTPLRKPKLEGLIEILEPIWLERRQLFNFMQMTGSLERAHERLLSFPWVGPFMSYEIVSDLRHTSALEEAYDINTWANAGPGASRGLRRLVSGRVDGPLEDEPVVLMRALHSKSRDPRHWPGDWPRWEMREVEHWLCEFDKYERARLGEGRPKQKYDPLR